VHPQCDVVVVPQSTGVMHVNFAGEACSATAYTVKALTCAEAFLLFVRNINIMEAPSADINRKRVKK